MTDTNQASEDELRESIDALLERWRNILTHKGDGNGDEYCQSDVVDDIQEVIRTEKLKARIVENEMYLNESRRWYYPAGPEDAYIPVRQFDDRIKELKEDK